MIEGLDAWEKEEAERRMRELNTPEGQKKLEESRKRWANEEWPDIPDSEFDADEDDEPDVDGN